MASSNADLKTRMATLRHEILSYKPGKAVSCDDERVVFPDKLVVGIINQDVLTPDIIPALRRALHGDVNPSKHADKQKTSTEDQEEYLTDSISVISKTFYAGLHKGGVQDLAGKVGCMVMLVYPRDIEHCPEWMNNIKKITGFVPLCGLYCSGDFLEASSRLKQHGITDMYEIPFPDRIQSDEDKLQLLHLLRGCLHDGDRTFATNNKICYGKTKKEAKEANQKMFTEVEEKKQELKKEREEDKARSEKEKRSLAAEMTKKLESKQHHIDTLTEIVGEKERNETTLTQHVEQLKKGREEDRGKADKEKRSLAAEMTKQLESKQQQVDTLTEIVGEKGRNETTLTQQVEKLKKVGEENRARAEKEKRLLVADVTKKLESKQQHVDTLTETVGEKERNEMTLRQQVEELKKGREEDRGRAEKDKRSLTADMTKKLESKQQQVDTLTEIVGEKGRNETTLRQQVEELKKRREEDRGRAEKDKRSLTADVTKKLESKQQQVDTLTEIVGEKGRNETTLRQQVEELKKGREEDRARLEKDKLSIELSWKKEHDYKERLEQLERETWKLRTKIQLESEMRSAEQKKKAETHQSSFIPWMTSGKQAQGDTLSFEDDSTGGLGRNDILQAGEGPPDDEFAGILQQIADDLYDEAKIDSLASQLGILHGDIQRALMTNVKFNRVTSDGTRHMLKQWRRGVSREDERIELKKALQAAKLVNLADLYLSEGVAKEQIEDVNDQ